APSLRLLDEPHAGLDATGRAVLDTVVASAADEDRTVIIASHELDRTRALAGREVVLAGGVARDGVLAENEDEEQEEEEDVGIAAPDIERTSDAKTPARGGVGA